MSNVSKITEQTPYIEFKKILEEEVVILNTSIDKAITSNLSKDVLLEKFKHLNQELLAHVAYNTLGEKYIIYKNPEYKEYVAEIDQRIAEILKRVTEYNPVKSPNGPPIGTPNGPIKPSDNSPVSVSFETLDALDTEIDHLIEELSEKLKIPKVDEIEKLVGTIVQKQNDLFQKFLEMSKKDDVAKIEFKTKALQYTREIVLNAEKLQSDLNKDNVLKAFSSFMTQTHALRTQIMTRFNIDPLIKRTDKRPVVLETLTTKNVEDVLGAFRSKKPLTPLPKPLPKPLPTPLPKPLPTPPPATTEVKQKLIEKIKETESDTDELKQLLEILNKPCDKTKLLIVLDFLLNTGKKKDIYQLLIDYVNL